MRRSSDLVCSNIMCEKVGEACICRLSRALERLPSLQWLSLAENSLETLPNSLSGLCHLQHLDVSQNSLTALPESMNNLRSLEVLDVRCNSLLRLPGSLLELQHLSHFAADGNAGLEADPTFRTLQERIRSHAQ